MLAILKTKPHNLHYLNRYVKFIEQRKNNSQGTELHHILPKAKDFFPEYKNLKDNPWNGVKLTYREHVIAHLLLWKTFGSSMACAYFLMSSSKPSKLAAKAREEFKATGKQQTAVSKAIKGTTTFYFPSGIYYGRIPQDSPIIKELSLIHIRSCKQKSQASGQASKNSSDKTVQIKKRESMGKLKWYYNPNTQDRIRSESCPEGWKEGRGNTHTVGGTKTYNDGIRNYRVKPDDQIDPSWIAGMAPQKSRKKSLP